MTMGNRPDDLERAISSLNQQRGVELDIVLLGNGWNPAENPWPFPANVRTIHSPENLGIPEGRNVGARAARGDYLFFYDDDAILPTDHVLADMVAEMEKRSRPRSSARAARSTAGSSSAVYIPRARSSRLCASSTSTPTRHCRSTLSA